MTSVVVEHPKVQRERGTCQWSPSKSCVLPTRLSPQPSWEGKVASPWTLPQRFGSFRPEIRKGANGEFCQEGLAVRQGPFVLALGF